MSKTKPKSKWKPGFLEKLLKSQEYILTTNEKLPFTDRNYLQWKGKGKPRI